MSSTSHIDVVNLSEEDIPVCAQLVSKSFGHDAPFVDIYFPDHDTAAGQEALSNRLKLWKHSSPNSTFLKAVSKSSKGDEELIGCGIWTLTKEAPPTEIEDVEDVEKVWPSSDDREFMARLWRQYVIPRTQVIMQSDGRGVYVLELLAVHPDYQRLGAGTALVTWGSEVADEKGLKAVVEGTPAGRRCYEKVGFCMEIEEMDFDVGDEYNGRRKPMLHFLTRESRTVQTSMTTLKVDESLRSVVR